MKEVEFISNDLAVIPEHGIVVNMASPEPVQSPFTPKPEKPNEGGNTNVAFWGEGNDFPQLVIESTELDTELPPLLDWKGRALQGREIVAVNLVFDDEKKDFKVERVNDQEINDFLNARTFQRYWREACIDFVWFAGFFPDLIKSVGLDKIAYLGVHEASWCRWSKQNAKGSIEFCYVSSNWPAAKETDPTTMKFSVIDPYEPLAVDIIKAKKNIKRFVYPANYPTPGKSYYPSAPWHSFLFSDWAKIKAAIPKMKLSLMNRIMSAKWVLSIPINYWPSIHKDWFTKKPEERLDIKKAKVQEINNTITGVDNAGKLILFEVGHDQDGKEIPSWKLEPLADMVKDGQHLEDSREASEHLMRGLNTDPTLVGDGPGKNAAGGGSGSDKRIAFNIAVALLQPYRNVLLEPLDFVAEYNGWKTRYPNLRFKVLEIELETLDKTKQTSEVKNPVTESNGTN